MGFCSIERSWHSNGAVPCDPVLGALLHAAPPEITSGAGFWPKASGYASTRMRDALLLVDVFDDFEHDHGYALRASFLERLPALQEVVETARAIPLPVIYANDRHGRWHGDRGRFLAELGVGADARAAVLAPAPEDAFFFKDHYCLRPHGPRRTPRRTRRRPPYRGGNVARGLCNSDRDRRP